jgi:hypothetical protein
MNTLRWDGTPGHYEVYYVSLTDRGSGCGVWIRYTMLAPLAGEATCALWFMAMDPRSGRTFAHKATYPIGELQATSAPFELRVAGAALDDHGMRGSVEGLAEWDLSWDSRASGTSHVHPLLERTKIAKTVLTLPHPDLEIRGTLTAAGRPLELDGARGGQAHLWGSKHANRWAWIHCNDFSSEDGEPRPGSYIDGVSVFVPRGGREIGPSTPVVGRFLGEDFRSINPARVLANRSRFDVTRWHLQASERLRRITADVDGRTETQVGVTYTDPDGQPAYCYNSEIASLRVQVWDRVRGQSWKLRDTLLADGRAHYEYAQREPLPDLDLQIT